MDKLSLGLGRRVAKRAERNLAGMLTSVPSEQRSLVFIVALSLAFAAVVVFLAFRAVSEVQGPGRGGRPGGAVSQSP